MTLAPSLRLGLPAVWGTGIPELDELLALEEEADFAEAIVDGWPYAGDGGSDYE